MAFPQARGALAAGVLGAFGASACCVAPLALAGLGIGGAGAAGLAALEPYRPLFIVLSLASLGVAFRRLYLRPACVPGEACATGPLKPAQRATFWVAALIAAALIAAPWVMG